MSNTALTQSKDKKPDAKPRKPNEQGTISVQAHMRIFDPKTNKTFVEGRA